MFAINRHELKFDAAPLVTGEGYKFIIPVPEAGALIKIPHDGVYQNGAKFHEGGIIIGADRKPIEGEGVVVFNHLHDHWVPALSGKQGMHRRIIVANIVDYDPAKIAVLSAKLKALGDPEKISKEDFYELMASAQGLGYEDFYRLRILNLEGMQSIGDDQSLYGLKYRRQRHPRRAVLLNSAGRHVEYNAFDCDPIRFNGQRVAVLHPSGQVTLLDTATFEKTYKTTDGEPALIAALPEYSISQRRGRFKSDLGVVRIPIIGGGASGIFAATRLVHELLEYAGKFEVTIDLIDQKPNLAGNTYNRNGVEVPMATPIGMLGVDYPRGAVDHMNRRKKNWEDSGYKYEPGVGFDPNLRVSYNEYGRYLREHIRVLSEWVGTTGKPIKLNIIQGEAVDVIVDKTTKKLKTRVGNEVLDSNVIILAPGNFEPKPFANLLGKRFYYNLDDRGLRPENINETKEITIIGTGNGAHFAALSAFKNGFRGNITLVSRTGRMPQVGYQLFDNQYEAQFLNEANIGKLVAAGVEITPQKLLQLFKQEVRAARRLGFNMQRAVDAVTPYSNFIWSKMSDESRAGFQKEFGNIWQNLRYRIPEEAAVKIDEYKISGRLKVKGGLREINALDGGGFEVKFADGDVNIAPKIVNVTGPSQDVRDMPQLIRGMCESGLAMPCKFGGLVVNDNLKLLAPDGEKSAPVFAIGPITFGCFPESIAIPAIREQAEKLVNAVVKQLIRGRAHDNAMGKW